MNKLKQLKEDNVLFYPVTVPEAVLFENDTTLADYRLIDALDILQTINEIFN